MTVSNNYTVSAILTQYCDGKKKTYPISHIVQIYKNNDNHVVIDLKKPGEMQTKTKKFIFDSNDYAMKFLKYIEYIRENGKILKQAYDSIDYKRVGRINNNELYKALASVDLKVSMEDIHKM